MMPPKVNPNQRRVSMAPGTKFKDGAAAAVTLSKNDRNARNVTNSNPIRRASMPRAADIRSARNAFANKIAEEKAEQERDMGDLQKKIDDYRKDNEKLLKNQRVRWGMTYDEMEVAREQLQYARESNDVLYRDLESKKRDCDKLQSQMESIKSKINLAMLEFNELNRERKANEVDRAKLTNAEQRVGKLFKANRDLRSILLRNKVDPNIDAVTLRRLDSPIDSPAPIRRVRKIYNKPEVITNDNLLSFRSMEDIRVKQHKQGANLKRTKSLGGHQYVRPKFFLTQYPDRTYKNVNVYV